MRSFTSRMAVQFALLITVTTAAVLAAGRWFLSREAVNGLDLLNQAEFMEIRDRLDSAPNAPTPADVDRRIRAHTEIDSALYFFQVRDSSGGVIFRSTNLGHAVLPSLPDGLARWSGDLQGVGPVRICEFRDGSLSIQVASPMQPVQWLLKDYGKISLFLLLGVALASIGLGWAFARLTLKPVRAIHATASRIRADNLGERIPTPAGSDELVDLVRLLNQMFDRLESSFSQVKRFTADASHELKTPLTFVRLNAEKLRSKCAQDPEATAAVEDILVELDRLWQITESLLFLAKAEGGALALNTTRIGADVLVREFAEDALALAEDRGAQFTVVRADSAQVQCEPTLVHQLLINLAINALRVSPPAGIVSLESVITSDRWRLVVSDQGPGVPPNQLERIFERFQRYTPTSGVSTTNTDAGAGLGLAICRSIATLHGGTIHAENRVGAPGLRVIVDIPLA
jgi:signal transduction histidine kinase